MRYLTETEISFVSGSGAIATAAATIGGVVGQQAGQQNGATVGAEIGGLACAALGPEAAAGCAVAGYFVGKNYGSVAGATAGTVLGEQIGLFIEGLISKYGDDILDELGSLWDDVQDGASWVESWLKSLFIDVNGSFSSPQTVAA